MAFKFDETEIKEWANELKDYSASRRNFFKPETRNQIVSNKTVKENEFKFNPILQVYRDKDEVKFI